MNQFKERGNVHWLNVASKPVRVLVVDDDLDAVHSMAMLIKSFGYDADFAINGFAALDVARRFRPDVILLDINLPDVNGDKLTRQLRFEPGLESTRIIAISGHSDEATKSRALEAGCETFYVKPIAPTTLEQLIQDSKGAAEQARR